MNFFRYLRLRAAQQMLCASYSMPVAILLTTVFSPPGTWSVPCFFVWFMTLMVLTWGGLALYTRDNDRVCLLADSRMIAVRNGKSDIVARMKLHEKARLVREVLLDDDVIRRQRQEWWRGISRYLTLSFRYLPATLLMTAFLLSWLEPETGVKIVEQLRTCPPESIVRWTAGGMASMYIITGLVFVMCDVAMDRLPVNCFREAFLAKVAAYQQHDDDTSFSGTDAADERAELREGGK
ncbi:hypothetical protein ISN41_21990 [Enterobacter bugandensis]|uniref:hypothetical protein n=1 Tax=Enterobacter bugandensis TaxID=881260 RepID=UPI0018883D00|nr:hypothetical protein [Enterobacter bugandensis]MBF2750750.1 hypothetical protein [Enterobacter bugandensis]MBF2803591.1 hypothetical protein [Enterobacter bugandensis]